MSDEFEESRVFLELCYFTVSLITDNMNPIQYFKSDFVLFMQPIISKFVSQFPGQSDRQILTNQQYKHLVQNYVTKIKKIIDAIKQSGLWIPQGGAPASIDATELIEQVLNSDVIDVDQLLLLRCVKTNQLIYSPELTLYYNACLYCCQSHIIIVRLYAYSLLRSAPTIVDLRHLFNVFKYAIGIWTKNPVSFEFCAAFHLLLSRFSEHRPSPVDENEFNLILQMIENLHNSENFETLMCFEPSLKWMYKLFSSEMLREVYKSSLESLKQNHYGDFCVICHCLALGIGDPSIFPEAVEEALKTVGCWAHPIQLEARSAFAALPLHRKSAIDERVIEIIAKALSQPAQAAEPALFITAAFITSYYLGTQANINTSLVKSLLDLHNEGRKNLTTDITSAIVAITSNPARLLAIIRNNPELRSPILSIIGTERTEWGNTLIGILAATPSYVIVPDSLVRAAVKSIREKALSVDDVAPNSFTRRLHVELPLAFSIYPSELRKIVEKLPECFDEDLKRVIVEAFAVVALQGRSAAECRDLAQLLPRSTFETECSELVALIDAANERPRTPFETLQADIDESLAQFLAVGSASHAAAALLFEHIVWTEGGTPLVVFKRLQLRPAMWCSAGLSTLFAALVADPACLAEFVVGRTKTPESLVYLAYALFLRLMPAVMEAITCERFADLPRLLFYPREGLDLTKEEREIIDGLAKRHHDELQAIFDVIIGASKR